MIAETRELYALAPNTNGAVPPDDATFEIAGWRACIAPDTPLHGLFTMNADGGRRALHVAVMPLRVVTTDGALAGVDVRLVRPDGDARDVFIAEGVIRSKTPADALHASCGESWAPAQAKALQKFLGDVVQVAHLPTERAMRRPRWDGERLILPGVRRMVPDDAWLRAYYVPDGDDDAARDAWREIVATAATHAKCALCVGAAVASVYARELGAGASNIHLVGDSRRGKTQTLLTAAAVFGDPHAIVLSWDTTVIGLGAKLEAASILPVFVDETGAANMKREQFEALLFRSASGRGRTRANRDGTARQTSSWASVVLTTGERGIVSSSALTGARARVLELEAPMTPDAATVDRMAALALAHAGAPARWMVADPRLDLARHLFADLQERLFAQLGGDSIDRTIIGSAALYLAGFVVLAERVGVASDAIEGLAERAADVLCESLDSMKGDGVTTADRLLAAIVEDVAAHPGRWNGEDPRECSGWRHADTWLAVLPGAAKRIARDIGIEDPAPALRALRDRGDVLAGDGRNLMRRIRKGSTLQRVYMLKVPTCSDSDSAMSEQETAPE